MKKFAIFVATTGGAIQIERLTEERAPQSMICVSKSTTILPISKEYHDYVRRGSGIIERDFNYSGDTSQFLCSGIAIDQQIAEIDSVCRYVAGRRRSNRRPFIAFDEWNVWYRTRNRENMWAGGDFPAHLVEEVYDLQDALVCAQFLMSFIRNADVVKIAS